jgi:hypothetical protein
MFHVEHVRSVENSRMREKRELFHVERRDPSEARQSSAPQPYGKQHILLPEYLCPTFHVKHDNCTLRRKVVCG